MTNFYLNQPTLLLREEPVEDSRVATEVFYSESLSILEEMVGWYKIRTEADGYTGWALKKDCIIISRESFFPDGIIARVQDCKAPFYRETDTVKGPWLMIPFRGKMKVLEDDGHSRWIKAELVDGKCGYIQRGNVQIAPKKQSMSELLLFAQSLPNRGIPYFFGGRTMWDGFDCSGLTQMLYEWFLQIDLPRDAQQQIAWSGCAAIDLEDLCPGDLIFWGKNSEKITHVGIYMGDDQFIHANVHELQGKISCSSLSSDLWNTKTDKFPYRAFRRVIQN